MTRGRKQLSETSRVEGSPGPLLCSIQLGLDHGSRWAVQAEPVMVEERGEVGMATRPHSRTS
jgi:hypothetical protein